MRHILLAKASQVNEIKQAKDTPAQSRMLSQKTTDLKRPFQNGGEEIWWSDLVCNSLRSFEIHLSV